MFCSGCGSKLEDNANFCSNCGQRIHGKGESTKPSVSVEVLSFSSNFILGGNLLTPDRLLITNSEVIYKKRNSYLIGVDKIVIPFKRISSVQLDRRLISTTVIVYTIGNEKIELKNFSIGDAKLIREAIAERIN